ncbi:MAG: DUF4087 domain-containing protein [Sphingomonadaceae bacterium]
MRYALLALALTVTPAHATEKRCGYLANPTPGNWWLTDRDRTWDIGTQGGYQARGMDRMPDMTTRGWVKTNGHYGYGCACMTVIADRKRGRIARILAARPVPMRQCKMDPKLEDPAH